MTKIKKFFDDNNSLNKGYKKNNLPSFKNQVHVHKRKYERFLPPINVITEYENIYPGILNKIINMAEHEQSVTHKARNQQLQANSKLNEYNKKVIIIITALICLSSTVMILANKPIYGLLFALLAFAALSLIPNKFNKE